MSNEIEKNVLGSFIVTPDPEVLHHCLILEEEDFFYPDNKLSLRAIKKLYTENSPIDLLTIQEEIGKKEYKPLQEKYLYELMEGVISSVNIKHHVDLLRKKRVIRESKKYAETFISDIEAGIDYHDCLGAFISNVSSQNIGIHVKSYKQLAKEFVPDFEKRFHTDYDNILKTGYKDLDNKIFVQKGDLIILAGRPSNGKSTFALNISEKVSASKSVLFISMEMKDKQLFEKTLSNFSKVNYSKIQYPKHISNINISEITANIRKVSELKINVLEKYDLTVDCIMSECELICNQQDIRLIVIDYLQLIEDSGKFGTKNDKTAEKTRKIKALAMKLGIPIILISQLNRQAVGRTEKKPVLSDLRDSGQIEADADKVIFVHRPYVESGGTNPNEAHIIVAKNRGGETIEFELEFIGAFQEFRAKEPEKPMTLYQE